MTSSSHSVLEAAQPPAHSITSTIKDGYKARKTQLLAALQSDAGSTRAIKGLLQALAQVADDALRSLWQGAELPAGVALVAVGGFGRGELFPHSDVDVLV